MFKFLVSTARKLHLAGPSDAASPQSAVKAKPVVRSQDASPRAKDNRGDRGAKEFRRPPMIF
jgi:hypothetical protein